MPFELPKHKRIKAKEERAAQISRIAKKSFEQMSDLIKRILLSSGDAERMKDAQTHRIDQLIEKFKQGNAGRDTKEELLKTIIAVEKRTKFEEERISKYGERIKQITSRLKATGAIDMQAVMHVEGELSAIKLDFASKKHELEGLKDRVKEYLKEER